MIVIPTYNEAGSIASLVKRIKSLYPDLPILIVDDSSTDGTTDIIKDLATSNSNISLLQRDSKLGLGSAYRQAFKQIVDEQKSTFVITMDGDLSHQPEAIAKLLTNIENYHFVVGSRYISGGTISNWGWWRRTLSRLGNLYARIFTAHQIHDLTSGFNAYQVKALEDINYENIRSDGYAFQIELKNALLQNNATFIEIPITFEERKQGYSKMDWPILIEGIKRPLLFTFKKPVFWIGTAIFLISFIGYAFTAPHTIVTNDNPEFVTAALTLGVPHPSGYPLYVILAWLFSSLPGLGSVYGVNLFSVLISSTSLVVLFIIIRRILKKFTTGSVLWDVLAASSVLTLAASGSFWYQAVIAKTYSLNLLLILIGLWLAIDALFTKKSDKLPLLGLLTGLAFANHQMSALILPFFFVPFLVLKPNFKQLAIAVGAALLGASVYLFLPIRSAMSPLLDWGHASGSLQNFLDIITRAQYSDIAIAGSWGDKLKFFSSFLLSTWEQFSAYIILAAIGLTYTMIKFRKLAFLLLAGLFGNSILIIILRSAQYNLEAEAFFQTYYLPSYAIIVIFGAIGLVALSRILKSHGQYVLMIIGVAPIIYLAYINFPTHNYHNFKFIESYYDNGLKSLPENSVIIFDTNNAGSDTEIFSLAYAKYVLQTRPDVIIVGYTDVFKPADYTSLVKAYSEQTPETRHQALITYAQTNYPSHPVFTTFMHKQGDTYTASNGYFYQLNEIVDATEIIQPNEQETTLLLSDYFGRQVLANYYYQQATYWLKRDQKKSQAALLIAITYDQDLYSWQYQTFIKLRFVPKQ